jgi:hypothetical protein
MKTVIASILCAGACVAATGLPFLRADPPPANVGKVVVLEGDRTLEGEVERVGEQYRVRRAAGETWLPAAKVLRLCADNAEALEYLRSRANLDDADEHLRLAQWCIERGLQDSAIKEVQAAAAIRPDHPRTKHLLERLQQKPPAPPPPVAPVPAVGEQQPSPAVDLTVEALAQFTTKVQPILMNTCAACHAGGRGGAFKLTRVNDGPARDRKTMQQNLAAVLAQVNTQQPQSSRLLTKAVTLHGDMDKTPALANRQAPAYQALEEWVRLTVANNPQLQDHVVALPSAAATPSAEPKASSGFASEPRTDPGTVRPGETAAPKPPGQPASAAPQAKPAEKAPAAADPYDPDEFNRQEHPERVKPPAAKKPS